MGISKQRIKKMNKNNNLRVKPNPDRSAISLSVKAGIRRVTHKILKARGFKPNRLSPGSFLRLPQRASYTDRLHRAIRERLRRGSSPSQGDGKGRWRYCPLRGPVSARKK